MNARRMCAILLAVSATLLATQSAGAGGPLPFARQVSHGLLDAGADPAAPPPDAASAAAVALGRPGTSFRYLHTFGVADAPYFEDSAHLNNPVGIATQGANVWIAEGWGERALKFSGAGAFLRQIDQQGHEVRLGQVVVLVEGDRSGDAREGLGGLQGRGQLGLVGASGALEGVHQEHGAVIGEG